MKKVETELNAVQLREAYEVLLKLVADHINDLAKLEENFLGLLAKALMEEFPKWEPERIKLALEVICHVEKLNISMGFFTKIYNRTVAYKGGRPRDFYQTES